MAGEVAYEYPHSYIPWLKMLPTFNLLRNDPRFQGLLRRMNLPQ